MESKLRLKDRLIRLFWQPSLLLIANCGGLRSPPAIKEKRNSKGTGVRKNCNPFMIGERGDPKGRTCPLTSPSSPPIIYHHHHYYIKEEEEENRTKKMMKKKTKKMVIPRSKRSELFSSSAMARVDEFGFFSSNEERAETIKEEDIETFFATRSFSSDSSDFYKKARKMKSSSRRPPQRRREKKSRCIWVNDGFQSLASISRRKEEEEEEAGFAVMKKSCDPYSDFLISMVEMIAERQIFGAGELRWLLNSYLSLNSVENHPVILKAFVDISQVLFGY